jgi:carbon-monoxide dehydrogenase large subunit
MTNKTPVGTYRGPGRFEADFFRERLFDMAAGDLGIERTEFRRRNLIAEADMPYALPNIAELDLATATDTGDYRSTLARCLAEIDCANKAPLQGRPIAGRYHGLAVGCYLEGGASGPKETARLVLEADGSIAVHVGSSANGQGLETALAQIAADALEMPIERIRVHHGSTDHLAEGFGTYSSRSTVMGGSAVIAAAGKLRQAIRAAAARHLGCEPDEVDIAEGMARGKGAAAGLSLGALAGEGIAADGSYASPRRTYSYGAHAAHVAVDPKTGHVAVIDYVAVEDVGRIVNPAMLHGQAIGAVVQGLGGTSRP